MRVGPIVLSCLTAIVSVSTVAGAAVEGVDPSAVSLDALRETELKDASPAVIRILETADRLVRQGVRYRRLKSARRLSLDTLSASRRSLSCSEFVWSVFSLARLDMGAHPVSSKRLAFTDDPYPGILIRVTDGSIRPGDLLVYAHPAADLAARGQAGGFGEISHVVVVVSARQGIVVGSHGRESSGQGEALGAGYRRLVGGWNEWLHGRALTATYRLAPVRGASVDE
jgi:hypothetical protein